MRKSQMPQAESSHRLPLCLRRPARTRQVSGILVAIAALVAPAWLMAGVMPASQTAPAAIAPTVSTHKTATTHKHHAQAPAKVAPLPEPEPIPPAPKPPDWPANDTPAPANVVSGQPRTHGNGLKLEPKADPEGHFSRYRHKDRGSRPG